MDKEKILFMMPPYVTGAAFPSSFETLFGDLSRKEGPFCFLETSLVRRDEYTSYFFEDPLNELIVEKGEDLPGFFEAIQEALSSGYYLSGWLSYELGYLLEPRLKGLLKDKRPSYPLAWLGVFRKPRIWVHEPRPGSPGHVPDIKSLLGNFSLDTPKERFIDCIGRIKEYIRLGDTYQVNYTMRGRFPFSGNPVDLYRALRARQPVPYGGIIKRQGLWILSLSPELFLKIKDGGIISRPMKGTVGRGQTIQGDDALSRWLENDIKNRAENVMIVDLLRNDIGKVARQGSVTVPILFEVERYETLFQMTSTISGHLKRDWPHGLVDALKALFPSGSVTGAPKIRTMEIIAELETSPRGVYCGAIGFIDPGGRAAFNVAIRTVVLKDGRGELGIGSGVTMGSDPEGEYEESILKGDFLREGFHDFSLIETILLNENGELYLLDHHLERLERSAFYFGFAFDKKRIVTALNQARASLFSKKGQVAIRLLLQRDGEARCSSRAIEDVMTPVPVCLSRQKTDPRDRFLYHKTTRREHYDRELREAREGGFFDCIFQNIRGEVTEGAITNVFVEGEDGVLITPHLEAGLLPGTLRETLLKEGKAREGHLKVQDLLSGRPFYVGNSVRGLLEARLVLDGP